MEADKSQKLSHVQKLLIKALQEAKEQLENSKDTNVKHRKPKTVS
ncbi:MAG: hypothetical protein UT66_C0058G0002 [candidate division CPR2 bacterium GW2011_GWC1_39_9]|nr:MAG: hypothetical protein UT66_C0058G0002 [candidate division CPR2 bacterium GW2011_GWC1_39_9]